eukprot:2779700-Pyramimonas_sp.AAC.1
MAASSPSRSSRHCSILSLPLSSAIFFCSNLICSCLSSSAWISPSSSNASRAPVPDGEMLQGPKDGGDGS